MRNERKKKLLCSLLILANLAFIWGNSLLDGADSGNLSGGILAWVNSILGLDASGAELLHHLIRKAAHFTEFACLGCLLAWRWSMDHAPNELLLPALLGMAAAVVDETIQLFTPDRGPSLKDVWIDTSGVITGVMLLILGQYVWKKYKLKQQ